ncbi:MAG: Rrf2 family transcriptional regulator [Planctomycetes bacterium]|nr:Rrf2 family transcriptional regulator [Planctomycetota bacterium]
MKFTALEEYGLRCLLRLAASELALRALAPGAAPSPRGGVSLTLGEIAAAEGLTQQYVGKIFRVLQRARFVESERGRKGGCRLARPPEKVIVGDVLDALGGRLFDGDVCGRYTGGRHVCVRTTDCAIRSLWRELQSMMDHVLQRTTLSDLLTDEHAMSLWVREQSAAVTQESLRPLSVGILPAASLTTMERSTGP